MKSFSHAFFEWSWSVGSSFKRYKNNMHNKNIYIFYMSAINKYK
ncbi:hypothetical protein GCWU000246_01842 [Jonquetella anthropi E3_33 E1]|nr:hypothetical protein GCWU000246_01842 [Jonquetella anthropi E3_33 E1]